MDVYKEIKTKILQFYEEILLFRGNLLDIRLK